VNFKAITIRQPWAHAVIQGWKPIENRSWPTKVRGTVAIHAAQRAEDKEFFDFIHKKGLEAQIALDTGGYGLAQAQHRYSPLTQNNRGPAEGRMTRGAAGIPAREPRSSASRCPRIRTMCPPQMRP
jgi:hypothetical protein